MNALARNENVAPRPGMVAVPRLTSTQPETHDSGYTFYWQVAYAVQVAAGA